MKMYRVTFALISVLAILLIASQAFAFEPAPGNRAYPIAGIDMISGDYYDLEDYRGKWVFVEFWASW